MTQVGRFLRSNIKDDNLILHITKRLLNEDPLSSFKYEELLIIQNACNLMFMHGIEILLLRETIYNIGASDVTILNRKIRPNYWHKIFLIIKHRSGDSLLKYIFNENTAEELYKQMHCTGNVINIVRKFIEENIGISNFLPNDLLYDGNILFSLGAIYEHRLIKLCAFFNKYWGNDEYERPMRLLCKHMWFSYLIIFGKLQVDSAAFARQRSNHELGIFSFMQHDYSIFCGILKQAPNKKSSNILNLFKDISFFNKIL